MQRLTTLRRRLNVEFTQSRIGLNVEELQRRCKCIENVALYTLVRAWRTQLQLVWLGQVKLGLFRSSKKKTFTSTLGLIYIQSLHIRTILHRVFCIQSFYVETLHVLPHYQEQNPGQLDPHAHAGLLTIVLDWPSNKEDQFSPFGRGLCCSCERCSGSRMLFPAPGRVEGQVPEMRRSSRLSTSKTQLENRIGFLSLKTELVRTDKAARLRLFFSVAFFCVC